jgi:crotonobetainyl-CoA:carnitine CoA-transferase CaiB-like acyl-CoA transferase
MASEKDVVDGSGAMWAAIGSIGTVGLQAIAKRLTGRDKLSHDAKTSETERLWEKNDQLEAKVEQAFRELGDCKDSHRQCESKYDALLVRLELVEAQVGKEHK